MYAFGGNGDGGKTAIAGTVIQYLIPPNKNGFTRVTALTYTDAGTSHTLTFLRSLGRSTASGANAAGQAVLNIVADPGAALPTADAIVANDFIALRESDGITRLYKVSVITSLAVTFTTNLVKGTVGTESFWLFGQTGDTDQRTGNTHPNFPSNSSSTDFSLTDANGGVVASVAKDEPILFNSNNATNAGKLKQLSWSFTAT